MNKTARVCWLGGLSALATGSNALAEDWVLVPREVTGYMNYQLSTPPAVVDGEEILPSNTFEADLFLIGVGLTAFHDRFYFDAFAQGTDQGSDVLEIGDNTERFKGDRVEHALTVGYQVTDYLSAYVGYRAAKTDFEGSAGGRSRFDEEGFFLGGVAGWPIRDYGVLSFNLALANLDGDIRFHTNVAGVPISSDAVSETNGLSYGLGWHGELGRGFSYSLAVDGYQYEFKDLIDRRYGGGPGKIEEDLLTVKLGLSYLIDM